MTTSPEMGVKKPPQHYPRNKNLTFDSKLKILVLTSHKRYKKNLVIENIFMEKMNPLKGENSCSNA
jgi:hypothetical protein